jgi:hypothetical protein
MMKATPGVRFDTLTFVKRFYNSDGPTTLQCFFSLVTPVGANRGACRSTRGAAALKLAILDHKDTVYKHVLESLRVLSRRFVCRLIDDSLGIEHRDISIGVCVAV